LSGEWLTYREAAGRLGSNVEAVRQRAIRCRWPRTVGNDKRARIQIPEGLPIPVREGNEGAFRDGNDRASRKGNEGAHDRPLIKALEAHVETLKAQLAAAEARIDKQADDLVAYDTAYADGLSAERAKAERVIAEAGAREVRLVADLEAERARTGQAIKAFADLADRLDAMAAARRPWWRRLAG
jgi:hypothetical protein